MTSNKDNSFWKFFASVKLALLILGLIAVTSIIGTLIPQKEAAEFYVQKYGGNMAQLIQVLDISDMYTSWWFLALLMLLAFNLVICSIDRFPLIWRQITADGLSYPEERLRKMANRHQWMATGSVPSTVAELTQIMRKNGWKIKQTGTQGRAILFSQKGNWTRAGVFIVHTSILVIFLGAIIGVLGGFKGRVMIPENVETDKIFLYGGKGTKELGFTVRCNRFTIDFYPNGMPKEYTSSLTVIEQGAEVLTKVIEVNDPLTYKGITFYQSSYEPNQDFIITITTPKGIEKTFTVPFQKQDVWTEEHVKFGILNAKALGQSVVSSKLWFSDGSGSPATLWADDGAETAIERENGTYLVSAKQKYATGLQVARDPGVWWVYIGFGLMLFGLYVAFFMSHRRIWLLVEDTGNGSNILLTGTANKNRPGFELALQELGRTLEQNDKDSLLKA